MPSSSTLAGPVCSLAEQPPPSKLVEHCVTIEVKNTSFTSHFSPLGIANCGKTLPGGRFKGRRRKTRRSKNCHSSPYSHITTTLSHSIAKTEKQVKTGRNSSSAKTNCSHSHTTIIWEEICVFQCFTPASKCSSFRYWYTWERQN